MGEGGGKTSVTLNMEEESSKLKLCQETTKQQKNEIWDIRMSFILFLFFCCQLFLNFSLSIFLLALSFEDYISPFFTSFSYSLSLFQQKLCNLFDDTKWTTTLLDWTKKYNIVLLISFLHMLLFTSIFIKNPPLVYVFPTVICCTVFFS